MSWSSAPGHSLDGQEWTCGHCIGPDGGMAHSSHNAADSRTVIDMPYFCLLSLLFELSLTPGRRDNSNKGYEGTDPTKPHHFSELPCDAPLAHSQRGVLRTCAEDR